MLLQLLVLFPLAFHGLALEATATPSPTDGTSADPIDDSTLDYVDSKRDADGLVHVEDVEMKRYTKDQSALIFHHDDTVDSDTLETVKALFQPLSTVEFEHNSTAGFWIDFGVTLTSAALQKELKLGRLPGIYLHMPGMGTMEYTGTAEVFALVEWLLKKTKTKIRAWKEVPFAMKDGSFEINQFNYDRFATESIFSMIYFYDDLCEICKSSNSLMEKLTEKFSTNGQPSGDTVFGSYRVTDANSNFVMDKFNLTSVPTILYHNMGSPAKQYTGPMKVTDLLVFIKGSTAGTMMQYTVELTGDRFHRYLKMKPTVFVKFISGTKDEHEVFTDLNYNGIGAIAIDWKKPAVFATFNITKYPDVVVDLVDTTYALYIYKWGVQYQFSPPTSFEDSLPKLEEFTGDLVPTIFHNHDVAVEPGRTETVVLIAAFPKQVTEHIQTVTQWAMTNKRPDSVEVYQTSDRRLLKRFNVTEPELLVVYPTDCVFHETVGAPKIRRIKLNGRDMNNVHELVHQYIDDLENYPLICGADYRGLAWESSQGKEDSQFVVQTYIHLDWGHEGHSHMTYWAKRIAPLAVKYREKGFFFTFADEDMHYDVISDYKLREGTVSEVLFTIFKGYPRGLPYYPTGEEMDDADSVTDLMEDYIVGLLNKTLRPKLLSERGAVAWRPGIVNKIVGNNLYDFMGQKDKLIVMILAYEYDEEFLEMNKRLEKKAAEHPDILFGRINCKSNSIYFNLYRAKKNSAIVKQIGVGTDEYVFANVLKRLVGNFEATVEDFGYSWPDKNSPRDEL